METQFIENYLLPILKTWADTKRKLGYIPTIELLVEELEEKLTEKDGKEI